MPEREETDLFHAPQPIGIARLSQQGRRNRAGGERAAAGWCRAKGGPGTDPGHAGAGRIGVALSDEFQLHPEQSTSAIVVLNPQAEYFSV